MFSRYREPFNAISHYAGAAAALVGVLILMWQGTYSPAAAAALLVYGTSLVLLFLSSAVYHTVQSPPAAVAALRKLDHSAIYLLIAGTYTPFCVLAFSGFWSRGFLALIWALAAAGVIAKLFMIHAPPWVAAGLYLVMGWLSVLALGEMLASLPGITISWLAAGGVIYTLGAGIYATHRFDFFPGRFGFHEIWHIFVLLGAAAHYTAVVSLV